VVSLLTERSVVQIRLERTCNTFEQIGSNFAGCDPNDFNECWNCRYTLIYSFMHSFIYVILKFYQLTNSKLVCFLVSIQINKWMVSQQCVCFFCQHDTCSVCWQSFSQSARAQTVSTYQCINVQDVQSCHPSSKFCRIMSIMPWCFVLLILILLIVVRFIAVDMLHNPGNFSFQLLINESTSQDWFNMSTSQDTLDQNTISGAWDSVSYE